jgi:hypothetical protein
MNDTFRNSVATHLCRSRLDVLSLFLGLTISVNISLTRPLFAHVFWLLLN